MNVKRNGVYMNVCFPGYGERLQSLEPGGGVHGGWRGLQWRYEAHCGGRISHGQLVACLSKSSFLLKTEKILEWKM